MTELEILDKIINESPANAYQICIRQMSGDADAYDNVYFTIKDKEEAEAFVDFCLAIKCVQDGGMTTRNVMGRLEESFIGNIIHLKNFGDKYANENEFYVDLISEICGYDSTCDSQWLSVIDSIKVFWYNKNSTKFNVKLK